MPRFIDIDDILDCISSFDIDISFRADVICEVLLLAELNRFWDKEEVLPAMLSLPIAEEDADIEVSPVTSSPVLALV